MAEELDKAIRQDAEGPARANADGGRSVSSAESVDSGMGRRADCPETG